MLSEIAQGGGSLWISALIFGGSAIVVWIAGTRLAGYADRLATATGLSGALVGLVLLGGITSLPEIATSATAAHQGAGTLAANNLVGGVALQLMALALVDALIGREALTATVPRADVLAYAAMNIGLLVLIIAFVAAGEIRVPGTHVGLGSLAVVAAYGFCVASARQIGTAATWRPAVERPVQEDDPPDSPSADGENPLKLGVLLALTGAVILVAGYLLARSGENLARETPLGEAFFGAIFLGGATSLPELSSAIAAVRLKRPQMAIGDVLGGNLFNLSLLGLVDGFYRPGPVLATLGAFTVVAACLAALLCSLLIVGLVERRDRTILRVGYDTAAMIAIFAVGLVALYLLRA